MMSALTNIIKANFGSYCSEDTIKLMLEQYYVSANYKGKYKSETKVTNDEVDKYYNEHKMIIRKSSSTILLRNMIQQTMLLKNLQLKKLKK